MRRIDRDRRQQQVEFLLAIIFDESPRPRIQFVQSQYANSMLVELRTQLVVPAAILVVDKLVSLAGDQVALFDQREAVGAGLGVAIFNLLHQAGYADFEKFVEIAGGDRKKLQPFQQWIAFRPALLRARAG